MSGVQLLYKKSVLIRRHYRKLVPYMSLRKLLNLMIAYSEFLFRKEKLLSGPSFIKVESSRRCNLACPACSHSRLNYEDGDDSSLLMTLEQMKKIIEPIHKTLFLATLTLQGEAFCNDELPAIIQYLHSKRIGTSFPSNFSSDLSSETMEKIVLAGLDSIFVSLDGASRETYGKYRKGGDYDLVLRNVKLLSEAKTKLKRKNPRIIWKFIVFPHNKHEIDLVTQTYVQLGFDSYDILHDAYGKLEEYHKQKKEYKQTRIRKKKACILLWTAMVINWKGIVHPCTKQRHDLGNALNDEPDNIWNGESYRMLRRPFRRRTYGEGMDEFCRECQGFEL